MDIMDALWILYGYNCNATYVMVTRVTVYSPFFNHREKVWLDSAAGKYHNALTIY